MEEWKQIDGFPYIISNKGNIINTRMNKPLKPYLDKGRLKITFYDNKKRYSRNLAPLVYNYFIKPTNSKTNISFKDGDYNNCSADNLILSRQVALMNRRQGSSSKTPILNSKKREGIKELPFIVRSDNYVPYADNCTVKPKYSNSDSYLLAQFSYNY